MNKAIKDMKRGKAAGGDEILLEIIEGVGNIGVEKMTNVANSIYETGQIPERMKESIFIAIPKKVGTTECDKHRIISLMSQVGKIILRVIMERVERKIKINIEDEQYVFTKRKEIFVLRTVLERDLEMQKDVYLCFVDFQKALIR